MPDAADTTKKPRGRPFTGRDDPRNRVAVGAAKAAAEKQVPALVAVEGEGLLGAIRHVLANHKAHDCTEEQRQARGWLKDDRAGFFREKAKLEAAELVAKGEDRAAAEKAAVEDVGSSAVLGLVDELIAKFEESPR